MNQGTRDGFAIHPLPKGRGLLARQDKPTYKNINMVLNNNVCEVSKQHQALNSKNEVDIYKQSSTFDYWLKLSTLKEYKPIYIPIESSKFYEDIEGSQKKSVQINYNLLTGVDVSFVKDIPDQVEFYIPKTSKISFDIGLKILFATNKGDMFGQTFYQRIRYYDKVITHLEKELKSHKIPLLQSERYMNLVRDRKEYVKNEINRTLNLIVKKYAPAEIVLENLNFQNPTMGRLMNRLLNTFGKRQIEKKLQDLHEKYGIIITKVNPAYTSQMCNRCGYVDATNRKDEKFCCKACGYKTNSDINGSKNILTRSSCEDLGTYVSRECILSKLVKKFVERYEIPKISSSEFQSRLSSKAQIAIRKNKYFSEYLPRIFANCNVCT